MLDLLLRPAVPADVDRLVEIHLASYPDPRSLLARRRRFEAPAFGSLEAVYVAEREGMVLGHALALPLKMAAHGRWVPVTGVATVGVAPEARGQGIASRLVAHLEQVARQRGDVACALYPFRQSFYARLGYAPTSPYQRVGFVPRAIPRAWGLPQGVRLLGPGAIAHAAIERLHADLSSRHLGALQRPPSAWGPRFADERLQWLFAQQGDALLGYVTFSPENDEPHARTTAQVDEICAVTPAIERGLWAALGAQRSQVARFEVDLPIDHMLPSALLDADGDRHGTRNVEHAFGSVCAGPMLKVLDAKGLVLSRGYPSDGRVSLHVGSEMFSVQVEHGEPSLVDGSPGPGPAVLDEEAFASLALGGVRAEELSAQGRLRGEPEIVANLGALFGGPRYFSRDPF